MAYCVHHIPGRVRFKVPKLQSDPAFAAEIEKNVLAVEGVIGVEVNRSAWSVIVHYDVDADPVDDVMEHISAAQLVNGANGESGTKTPLIRSRATSGSNGHHSNGGPEMSRVVGQAIGQAIFAALVQRTLDRSLISILTGLR